MWSLKHVCAAPEEKTQHTQNQYELVTVVLPCSGMRLQRLATSSAGRNPVGANLLEPSYIPEVALLSLQ